MKKIIKFLPLVVVASLTACESYKYVGTYDVPLLLFGTTVSVEMQIKNDSNGGKTFSDIKNVLKQIDELTDATKQREATNVWSLNHTNDKLEISEEFYYLLKRAKELQQIVPYFNPLIGSLSNKWKESLNFSDDATATHAVLSDDIVQEELQKINSSELIIEETEQGWYAQRVGEAQIDLGAFAKGYALDACLNKLYHRTAHTKDYLFNLGNSSILTGYNSRRYRVWKQPDYEKGVYIVNVTNVTNEKHLRIFNSFISTSGISEQKAVIDDKTYSHIINPITGSAEVGNYDQITVISGDAWSNGALGDVLSTSLMLGDENDIKKAEKDFEVKIIALKDGKIEYKSDGVTLYF